MNIKRLVPVLANRFIAGQGTTTYTHQTYTTPPFHVWIHVRILSYYFFMKRKCFFPYHAFPFIYHMKPSKHLPKHTTILQLPQSPTSRAGAPESPVATAAHALRYL